MLLQMSKKRGPAHAMFITNPQPKELKNKRV
jgi:hypothetical protein